MQHLMETSERNAKTNLSILSFISLSLYIYAPAYLFHTVGPNRYNPARRQRVPIQFLSPAHRNEQFDVKSFSSVLHSDMIIVSAPAENL